MTAESARTAPVGASAGNGDVVISIDAMSGDRGVSTVVRGMSMSLEKNPRLRYLLHGDADILRKAIAGHPELMARTDVQHAAGVIAMDEKPSRALRAAQGTSMWSALQSVKAGHSPVVISCGNTGALMAMSMLALRKAPGVNRPAIAVLWPSRNKAGYSVMLDAGADIRADADDLVKYAVMGASYARNALGLEQPRVGLLNVGTEPHKGRSELHEAADRMAAVGVGGDFQYIGYVEGSDIPSDRVDVIVTDGFTGNVALKTGEGTARLIQGLLREAFDYSVLSKIGALFALTSLKRLQKRIDPRRVNGGVFLGLNGTVIKSHGSADATGVSAAIKLAFTLAENGFTQRLVARVGASDTGSDQELEPGSPDAGLVDASKGTALGGLS